MEQIAFLNAIKYGDLAAVQELYDACIVNGCCANGKTVLSYACVQGQLDIVKWLVTVKRVDVNQQRSIALKIMPLRDCFDMARFLLENGAKVREQHIIRRIMLLHDIRTPGPQWMERWFEEMQECEEPTLRLFMLWGGHLSPTAYKKLRKVDVGLAQWYCRVWDSVQHVLNANAAAVTTTLMVLRFGSKHGADIPLVSKDMATHVAKLVYASRRDFDMWNLCDNRNKRMHV